MAADMQNMQTGPELDVLRKRPGLTRVGTNLPLRGAVMHLDQFWKKTGEQWPIIITTAAVYYYDYGTRAWVDISPAGGLHGTLDDAVSADIIYDTFIFTNGIDPIMRWTGPGVAVSPLPNTTFRARCVRKFKERLVALGDPNEPQMVRWTAPGTIDDWSGPGSGAAVLSEGVDWIVTAEVLGDALAIYKERSVVLCTYVGGDLVFRFDQIVAGIGVPAAKAVMNLGNEHILLAWDDIYEYQGGRAVDPIGDPIQEILYPFSNPQAIRRSCAVVVEERNEIWFFVPSGGSDVPNVAWVYNYATGRWFKHQLRVTATGYWDRQHDMTLGSVQGTIGEQTARFGDRTFLALSPLIALGTGDGLVLQVDPTVLTDDLAPIPAYWVSKQFDGGEPHRWKRWVGVEFEANAYHVKVEVRVDDGEWTTVADVSSVLVPSPELYPQYDLVPRMEPSRWKRFKADFDVPGKLAQFRFSDYGGGVDLAIRSLEPKFIVTGRP